MGETDELRNKTTALQTQILGEVQNRLFLRRVVGAKKTLQQINRKKKKGFGSLQVQSRTWGVLRWLAEQRVRVNRTDAPHHRVIWPKEIQRQRRTCDKRHERKVWIVV